MLSITHTNFLQAEGNVGVIGWGTMPDDNEFLEMRVAHGGDVAPHGLGTQLTFFTSTKVQILTQKARR